MNTTTNNNVNGINWYKDLLKDDYKTAINKLLEKYGEVTDDYFIEDSYDNFLLGKTDSIERGKYSRTKDGLYCHHIKENEFMNIAQPESILRGQYPFYLQQKDKLVYCNLIEHTILHALIAKETNHNFGVFGLMMFLVPQIKLWYVDDNSYPMESWKKNCYKAAYLTKDQANEITRMILQLASAGSSQSNQSVRSGQSSQPELPERSSAQYASQRTSEESVE